MHYRVAIQGDSSVLWQWKSTALSSLQSLFQVLRLYRSLPQEDLRVFSSPSREGLEEQLAQENKELGSHSVTAAQFLQERMIRSYQASPATSACEAERHQERAPIAVSTRTQLIENGRATYTLDAGCMSSLEMRRLELELGPGGDHDLPYTFALPASMPQVLAWMRLLGRIQRGEGEP
jgi:hypothetical protein